MICPRCQYRARDDANFCHRCGAPLPPPKPSPFKTGILAFLRAMFYYILFVSVQSFVIGVYTGMIAATTMYKDLINSALDGDMFDFLLVMESVNELLYEKIHMLLILSALITVLIVFLSLRIRNKDPMAETHIRPISKGAILPALLLGAALQVFSVITISLIPIPADVINSFNESSSLLTGGPLWLELLSVVIVTPILEELIFRGLVFTRLRRGMSATLAVLLSAGIFGWAHGHIISFLYAGVFGVFLAILMLRQNDSILAPILCHAGFNGTSYLLGLLGDEINTLLFFALYLVSIAIAVLCSYLLFRKRAADSSAHTESTSQ